MIDWRDNLKELMSVANADVNDLCKVEVNGKKYTNRQRLKEVIFDGKGDVTVGRYFAFCEYLKQRINESK